MAGEQRRTPQARVTADGTSAANYGCATVANPDGEWLARAYRRAMTTQSSGGDGLMAFIAGAVIFIVILEATFVAYASWLLLGLVLFGVIVAAIAVITALVRVIDHDTPIAVSPPQRKPRPEPEPAKTPAPARLHGTPIAH
jgi:hypothetical protein